MLYGFFRISFQIKNVNLPVNLVIKKNKNKLLIREINSTLVKLLFQSY